MKNLVTDEEKRQHIYPTIFPNWDHTPRSGKHGLVVHRSEPEYFDRHMKEVVDTVAEKPSQHRIAFIKSWNEWAEGNYLEPDLKYGMAYLEVIKKHVCR